MAGDDTDADVFAVPPFWQASRWPNSLDEPISNSSFFGQSLTDSICEPIAQIGVLTPVVTEQQGFFKLPSLELGTQPQEDDPPTPSATSTEPEVPEVSVDESVNWDGTEIQSRDPPSLKTWNAFITGKTSSRKPVYLSEAGPRAYDALLRWEKDPLQLQNQDVPVVETKVYFAALVSLSLGLESIFFSRQQSISFKPTMAKFRISGYSRDVLQGVEAQSLACGTTFLKLQSFVQFAYTNFPSRCGVALASALDQIFRAIQQHVAAHGRRPHSLLHLQSMIRRVAAVLDPVQLLVSQLHREQGDEEILSVLFHQACVVENRRVQAVMREIMRRVSVPWIEFVEEWIGTRQEKGMALTKSNVGESRGFVKVEELTYMDDFGRDVTEVDYLLDRDKVPDFMTDDLMSLLFATGRNLRFIRSFHPDHPLSQPNLESLTQPPKAEWQYEWDAILQLEHRVSAYRDRLAAAVQKTRLTDEHAQPQHAIQTARSHSPFCLDVFSSDADQLQEQMQASIVHMSSIAGNALPQDPLSWIVGRCLDDNSAENETHVHSSPYWSLLPMLSFGGIASAQSAIVNKESMRLLFSSHNLRQHLRLQRDFHLLGNGMFCNRLSHALFDPELSTATRRSGIALQGDVMGLRLGGRDTWPPASSELRLALMGVLAESYNLGSEQATMAQGPGTPKSGPTGGADLPGDLSFAVRDLSPEEIDLCMNPDSLQALDFLRLSYTAPPELNSVITPVILTQYDRIFKLLLRVLRMLFVTGQLFRDVHGGDLGNDATKTSYMFVREARHFVSSLASYFMDTCIGIPWQDMEIRLDKAQKYVSSQSLDGDSGHLRGPDDLRELHSQLLDRIMTGLFLRKRQQAVLRLVEDIFTCVLAYAKHIRLKTLNVADTHGLATVGQGEDELYSELKKKTQVFVTVCRGLTEKGRMGSKQADGSVSMFRHVGMGEDSMVAQLLLKLDMR